MKAVVLIVRGKAVIVCEPETATEADELQTARDLPLKLVALPVPTAARPKVARGRHKD